MLISVLRAVLFGRKVTGTVCGYESAGIYRSVESFRYIVMLKMSGESIKVKSAESFKQWDGKEPSRHFGCEITVYYYEKSDVCTLIKPADIIIAALAVVLILMIIGLVCL